MAAEAPTIAVLAGGLATRLGKLAAAAPKALIDIAGRPFLSWQFELFAAAGLRDVVLCIGHYGEQIEQWVASNPVPGLRVRFSHDGPTRRGTGGALRSALPLLGSPFLVTYGDSYLRCDHLRIFRNFLAQQRAAVARPPLGLMTIYENHDSYDASNVVFRAGRLLNYDKLNRVPEMKHIDYGLGVLTREAFDSFGADEAFDLAQVYQRLLAADRLAGYEVTERFYEVGSRAGIDEFREFVECQARRE